MKRIDFENGNIVSNILKAALPMLVAQIMSLLYNIVDRVYIARIPDVGTTALGAVGLCFPIIVIITAFSNLFGTGGAPIFSIERGKGNHAKAGLLMNTSFTLLALCAVILMIVGLLFARPILVLFGASDAGLAYAYPYLMIYLLGTFPSMAATGMNPFINAQGYATTGMTSVIIGAVANLLLDPLFIFAFHLGVRGAALATILSQAVSCIWVLSFLCGKKTILHIRKKNLILKPEIILPCVALGLATFIMQASESIISVCFNSSLLKYGGDIAVGAMTILTSVMQFAMLPLQGLGQGAQPVLSYNYGAKNADRVKKTFRLLVITCLTYSTLLWAAVQIIPKVFVSIFTADASLINFTAPMLRIYLGGLFLFGIQIACQMTFTSLGKAVNSIVVAVVRKFVLLLPLIYIMPHVVSNPTTGVYMAEPIADIIAVLFTSVLFSFQFKKALAEIQNENN